MEKISVIVPVYNSELYLEKCITSIINQSYENLEIILINDGSIDNSKFICEKYESLDPRIILINKEHGGVVSARKAGSKRASGEFIGTIDADDYIEFDYYEILYKYISSSKAQFVHSGLISEDTDGIISQEELEEQIIEIGKEKKIEFFINSGLDYDNAKLKFNLCETTKLYRTNLFKECYDLVPNNCCYGEDPICNCHCILKSDRFQIIPYSGYHYVRREKSISHADAFTMILGISNMCSEIIHIMSKECCEEVVKEEIEKIFMVDMVAQIGRLQNDKFHILQYKPPYLKMMQNKRIVIYGAGNVGYSYVNYLMSNNKYKLVAWIDKKFTSDFDCLRKNISVLDSIKYDYILIAVKGKIKADIIKKNLLDFSVDQNKILWCEPEKNF